MSAPKKNVLLVGSGAIGTMGAFGLEAGGKASVTAVLRSNYAAVKKDGFDIDSCDYGVHKNWRPSSIVNKVPDATAEGHVPFDYIVVATKNCPDIKPTVSEIIAPAVTKGHSVIVLVQNGLNIEQPLIAAFPENIVLSGVSLMGVSERGHGTIVHDFHDSLFVGPFKNPGLDKDAGLAAAQDFVDIYGASGKVTCEFQPDVDFIRWRKLIYNTSFNSVAAITRMDTSRMRLAKTPVDDLIRPAMQEVFATAKAAGIDLPADIIETTINIDPIEVWSKPSMLQDVQKGNFIEYVNIVEAPIKEAERLGVPTPTLKVILGFCRALQWQTMEAKGMVTLPAGAAPP